jgi:hypothetical protein
MICSVKPVLTEELCEVHKEEFSIAYSKRQTHLLVREDVS